MQIKNIFIRTILIPLWTFATAEHFHVVVIGGKERGFLTPCRRARWWIYQSTVGVYFEDF
jgi:hypothetical protein